MDGWRTSGPQWGDTLKFWYELARFARRLYEERHYVPGLARLEGKSYPTWQAVFSGRAEQHWQQLLEAMPPLCRAVHEGNDQPQDSPVPPPLTHPPTHPDAHTLPMPPDADPSPPYSPTHMLTCSHTPHAAGLTLSFLDACLNHLARRRLLRRAPSQVSLKKSSSPLPRQWLNILKCGHFQSLHGSPATLERFINEVESWTNYLRPAGFALPWRLAFELSPPEAETGPWTLRYVLASAKDPAERLSAEQVWHESALERYGPVVREALLTGLGQALGALPKIADSLAGPAPTDCELTRDEAIEFMTETVPQLRRLGFFVYLPDWWEGGREALGVRLHIGAAEAAGQDRPTFLGLEQLVDYHWEIALGDRTLDEAEFGELARLKQQVVFRHGRWLRLDAEALNRSLEFLEREGRAGKVKLSKVLKLGGELQKSGGLPLMDFIVKGDFTRSLDDLEPDKTLELLPAPAKFRGTLPPYQVHGFSWMLFLSGLGLGACLADDMGLGKTVQMIAVLAHEFETGGSQGPTLIISPMSVVGNWHRELQRFAPHLEVMVHHGSDRQGRDEFLRSVQKFNVVISTYNLVVRDHASFRGCRWHNLVLDEAQNIKNPNTKQAKAIRSLISVHCYCLTGTPIENRLSELWSIMDFLNPGCLGNLSSFRRTFSQPIERERDEARAGILQRLIQPFILRRLKSDREIIRDLPAKKEMKVFCNLTAEQAGLYQGVVDDMLAKVHSRSGVARKGLVLAALTKLKQITNHPVHFLRDASVFSSERSGKLQRLEEMLEVILEAGDKALIFSQFTEIGELMRAKLQERFDVEVLYLHGGSSKTRRDEMIQRFQHAHGPPIFLLSLKAGGVGLNLTAANHVFHFDRWWNPAVEDQATDRSYRLGQTKNVQVHKFICIGTVEEKIDQMIEDKKRLADNIVSTGESMLTELSTEDLREVFALTRDAVVE